MMYNTIISPLNICFTVKGNSNCIGDYVIVVLSK